MQDSSLISEVVCEAIKLISHFFFHHLLTHKIKVGRVVLEIRNCLIAMDFIPWIISTGE